jgi:polygalacturonase
MPAPGEYNVALSPYFADGDSGTDQTTPIKDAIDDALDNGGGTVYIPSGYYNVNNTLLDSFSGSTFRGSNVTIRGDGPGEAGTAKGTTLMLSGNVATTSPIFKIHGSNFSTDRAHNFTLKELTLDGNGNSGRWIDLKMASNVRLDRVNMINTRSQGIYAVEWTESVVHDCYFDDVGKESGPSAGSIELAQKVSTDANAPPSQNLVFEGVRFANNRYYAFVARSGAQFLYFQGCSFLGHPAMDGGAPQYGTSNVRLEGVYVAGFTGCFFKKAGTYHLSCLDSSNLTITTCTFHEAWNYAVLLNNTSHCAITVNSFAKADGTSANGLSGSGGDINEIGSSTGSEIAKNL